MRKQIEVQIPDLFNLQPSIRETILEHIKKEKRTTQSITSKKCKCSIEGARRVLLRLVDEGLVRDLGLFMVNSRKSRVFEVV